MKKQTTTDTTTAYLEIPRDVAVAPRVFAGGFYRDQQNIIRG